MINSINLTSRVGTNKSYQIKNRTQWNGEITSVVKLDKNFTIAIIFKH